MLYINPFAPERAKTGRPEMPCYSCTGQNRSKKASLFCISLPSPKSRYGLHRHLSIVFEILTNHIAVTVHNKTLPRMRETGMNFALSHELSPKAWRLSRCISGNHLLGIDREDQFRSYYTVGRQSRKWYYYIFWFLFNVAASNAYILEREHRRRSHQRTQPQADFHLELWKRLINGHFHRKRPAVNQVLAKEPRTDHQAVRLEGWKKECVLCKFSGTKTPKGYPIETKKSVNSVMLRYAKCSVLPSIMVRTLEHWNRLFISLFHLYRTSRQCKYTVETENKIHCSNKLYILKLKWTPRWSFEM